MFKKILEVVKSLKPEGIAFDPATFNDPLALQTEWGPAAGGGTNFRTHKLVQVDASRYEFRASWGSISFGLIFVIVGIGVMAIVAGSRISDGEFALNGEFLMFVAFGLIFAGAGGAMLYYFTAPIVFDKRSGLFWKGRTAPEATYNREEIKAYAELSDIHALQVIAESVSGNKSSYISYELNLVLSDGRRINVIDHGDKVKLLVDAHDLADFLDIPVWNAVGYDLK